MEIKLFATVVSVQVFTNILKKKTKSQSVSLVINRRHLNSTLHYTDETCPLRSMFSPCTRVNRASRLSLGNASEEATPRKAPELRQIVSNIVIRGTKQNCWSQLDQLHYHQHFIIK